MHLRYVPSGYYSLSFMVLNYVISDNYWGPSVTFRAGNRRSRRLDGKDRKKEETWKPTERPSCLQNQSQQPSKHHSRNQPKFYLQSRRPNQYAQQEKPTPSSNAPHLPSLTTEQRIFSDPSDGFGEGCSAGHKVCSRSCTGHSTYSGRNTTTTRALGVQYSHPKKPKDRGGESRRSRGQADRSFNVLMEKSSKKECSFNYLQQLQGPPKLSTNTSGEQKEFRVDNCQQQNETSKDPINPPGEPENPSINGLQPQEHKTQVHKLSKPQENATVLSKTTQLVGLLIRQRELGLYPNFHSMKTTRATQNAPRTAMIRPQCLPNRWPTRWLFLVRFISIPTLYISTPNMPILDTSTSDIGNFDHFNENES
jgi:hypothetical protein